MNKTLLCTVVLALMLPVHAQTVAQAPTQNAPAQTATSAAPVASAAQAAPATDAQTATPNPQTNAGQAAQAPTQTTQGTTSATAANAPTNTAANNAAANGDTATATEGTTDGEAQAAAPAPNNPHDPNAPTLAELQTPEESELSRANTELLAKNAELENRVTELTTQVNVLVNERSGQLFLYGAFTVLFSMLFGAWAAWFVLKRKKSDW